MGGAGNICLPTPSIYISLSFPSHLWLVVAVAVFAERNQRRSEPLSRSTAIRNANVSHLPHSRVAVALGLLSPEKLKSEKICSNTKKKILFYSSSSTAMVRFSSLISPTALE